MFTKAVFSIDGEAKQYAGFSCSERWNGWACPRFTKEEGERMAQEFLEEAGVQIFHYDEATDAFQVQFDNGELQTYEGHDIEVKGQTIHVYSIGAWSWIWVESKRYEVMLTTPVFIDASTEDEAKALAREAFQDLLDAQHIQLYYDIERAH